VAAFLLLGMLLGMLLGLRGLAGLRSSLGSLGVLLASLFAYLLVQRVALPQMALAWLSPGNARLYQTLLGDTARWLPLSLDPHASGRAIIELFAYVSMFLVVAAAPERKRSLAVFWLWTLLVAAALIAAVAWLHLALGWSAKLFDTFPSEQGSSGPGRLS